MHGQCTTYWDNTCEIALSKQGRMRSWYAVQLTLDVTYRDSLQPYKTQHAQMKRRFGDVGSDKVDEDEDGPTDDQEIDNTNQRGSEHLDLENSDDEQTEPNEDDMDDEDLDLPSRHKSTKVPVSRGRLRCAKEPEPSPGEDRAWFTHSTNHSTLSAHPQKEPNQIEAHSEDIPPRLCMHTQASIPRGCMRYAEESKLSPGGQFTHVIDYFSCL